MTARYNKYAKRDVSTGETIEAGLETGVSPLEMRTELCWAEVPPALERAVTDAHADYLDEDCEEIPPHLHGYLGGIHAIEHAMIAVTPLELTVDPADLGGLATNRLPDRPDRSGWFIYDGVDGGLGFAADLRALRGRHPTRSSADGRLWLWPRRRLSGLPDGPAVWKRQQTAVLAGGDGRHRRASRVRTNRYTKTTNRHT